MNGEILMVSDALCYGPFASGPQTQTGPEKAPVVATDSDPIRARLADTARQEERRSTPLRDFEETDTHVEA